ncbi:MAG: nucleotidyltransferase family protein [Lachnospiraceae bacterium]|nr:nucleotidyltransferase family protein [Lachnospiraceae bacterium]
MGKKILVIVASGKSSRFGGFPKAFCEMNKKTNAENTYEKAKKVYDKVYIGVNRTVYEKFKDKINGCEMFSIISGQGDAHSLLKCINYVKGLEGDIERISACWGDAVFVDSTPFERLEEAAINTKIAVACAVDEQPYAWFETTETSDIIKSHFLKEDGVVESGLHDQSLFSFDCEFAITYLNKYREMLGILQENDETVSDINEMKLLKFFEYLYENGYTPAKCIEVLPDKVLSFNTVDELEIIKNKIQM